MHHGRPGASGSANARPASGDPAAAPRRSGVALRGAPSWGRPGALCVACGTRAVRGGRACRLKPSVTAKLSGVLRLAPEGTPRGGGGAPSTGRVRARAAGLCASPGRAEPPPRERSWGRGVRPSRLGAGTPRGGTGPRAAAFGAAVRHTPWFRFKGSPPIRAGDVRLCATP